MQKLGLKYNFWFGHQGWEYTDIGRFWQIFLFIGLLLWLVLVGALLLAWFVARHWVRPIRAATPVARPA